MHYKKTALPNGVRVITIPMKGSPTVTVMVAAETGSNYEEKGENGLAHFLEHMVFKGTDTRPSALAVSLELDRVGAESNAFTSNEMTAYYAKGEKRHFRALFDVVSDIYLNPTLPPADLEKERGVIIQEISMYEDLPQRHVWDVLARLLYGDTPAGRPIIGPATNIRKFKREDFINYRKKHYVPEATIVVVAGDIDHKAVESLVKKAFSHVPKAKKTGKPKVKNMQTKPALLVEKKASEQTHMILAFRSVGARDKRALSISMLMSVLGSGMSSRLFQKLREEMGACYYIRAVHDAYTDHGFGAISAGIDKNRIVEVTKALIEECRKLTTELVSDEELQKAKDYAASHMYMGLETSDSQAGFYLEGEIVRGRLESPQELEAEIRAISAKDIMKAAKLVFSDKNMNLAVVGDIADTKPLKKILIFK